MSLMHRRCAQNGLTSPHIGSVTISDAALMLPRVT